MAECLFTPTAARIVATLQNAGYAAYYVGGCVRDRLCGYSAEDVDIATNARLEDITRLFPRATIIGKAFSVALVDAVEVATFRIDGPYSDARHPDYIHFTDSLEQDLARRDFTINAMACTADGTLIDPYGGQEDLQARCIRFVGEPDARVQEDPLRALRACRFAAKIGGTLAPETREALCRAHADVGKLARERVQMELSKMLMQEDRTTALTLLQECGLLSYVLPRLAASVGVPQEGYHAEDCWVHAVATVQHIQKKSLPLRLAALLHDIAKPQTRWRDEDGVDHFYGHEREGEEMAADELRDLRYSNDIINYVREATYHHMARIMFDTAMGDAAIRRRMAALQHMPIRDLLRIQLADMRANFREPYTRAEQRQLLRYGLGRIRAIESQEHALKITDLAVTGHDVMRVCAIQEGKDVGKYLHALYEEVLEKPEINTRAYLLKRLAEMATDRSPPYPT